LWKKGSLFLLPVIGPGFLGLLIYSPVTLPAKLSSNRMQIVIFRIHRNFIIIIKNKKEKTCKLIDVAIPADRNVAQKEAEKKLKYKSLCIEI
jgi:hypothetical protein